MDFFYYNKNNEKIRLSIEVGTDWDNLNIENPRLNSIFSKIDDGDNKISDQQELNLLKNLLNKADGILNTTVKNNVLENEELDEIIRQIDEGKISLPKKSKADEKEPSYKEHVTHHPSYSKDDLCDLKNPETSEKVYQKHIDKIKENLMKYNNYSERFPEDRYETEVVFNGKYYESFVYEKASTDTSKDVKKLFQSISIIRPDGIELTITDNFDGNISDDDNENFIIDDKSPIIILTDKYGKTRTIKTIINGGEYTILDFRRQERALAEYFLELSEEKMQKLIENNVTNITFDSEPDEEFPDVFKLDENGECFYIYESFGGLDGTTDAEIISPKFAPPKVNQSEQETPSEQQFKTNSGYEINIKNNSPTSAIMTIKSQTGSEHSIEISTECTEEELFQKAMLPRLSMILKELPKEVIEDLIEEVDNISIMKNGMLGYYEKNSNTLSITLYDIHGYVGQLHPKITLIHELGHSIDNNGKVFITDNPEFTEKFNKFAKLAEKFEKRYLIKTKGIKAEDYEKTHALESPQEFFASVYADIEVKNENIAGNYIAELDKIILAFRDSKDSDEQNCYKLYLELKNEVKNIISEVRTKSNRKQ